MLRNTDPAASRSTSSGPAIRPLESHWVTAGRPLPHMLVGGEGSGGWHPVRWRAQRFSGGGAGARVSRGCERSPAFNPASRPVLNSALFAGHPAGQGSSTGLGSGLEGSEGSRASPFASSLAQHAAAAYHATRMRRADVLQIIAQHAGELRELGVRSLSLFGSVARDQAAPGSDVDLLVDFDPPVGYFHLLEVQDRLEAFLGCKVDLVTQGGLRPELRQQILSEAVRAA